MGAYLTISAESCIDLFLWHISPVPKATDNSFGKWSPFRSLEHNILTKTKEFSSHIKPCLGMSVLKNTLYQSFVKICNQFIKPLLKFLAIALQSNCLSSFSHFYPFLLLFWSPHSHTCIPYTNPTWLQCMKLYCIWFVINLRDFIVSDWSGQFNTRIICFLKVLVNLLIKLGACSLFMYSDAILFN